MFRQIRKNIERQLNAYCQDDPGLKILGSISPLLFKFIREFILRPGKRIRPTLFVIGYKGYSNRNPPGLFKSALALELLHDFLLIHDDIIDRSTLRRGAPSMHNLFNIYLKNYQNLKFNGQDLSIVAGDIVYAMAIHVFLSVKEAAAHKENALRRLIESAFYTGSGEFLELLLSARNAGSVKRRDILRVYDLKTANYTFASPLAVGATLAGAPAGQIKKLYAYGAYLGRAFQIKDDIIGMFGKSSDSGKSNLTDLKEAKKTLLISLAYQLSGAADKMIINKTLCKKNIAGADLVKIRRIVIKTGALEAAKDEIRSLLKKALALNHALKMKPTYKKILNDYCRQILSV